MVRVAKTLVPLSPYIRSHTLENYQNQESQVMKNFARLSIVELALLQPAVGALFLANKVTGQ